MRNQILAAAVALCFAVTANAQTFRGAISGSVTDPSGAVVPNAQVKATETGTGLDHTTLTTNEGRFAFQDIPLGFYKVTVMATGFAPFSAAKVEVVAGKIYTLPISLQPARLETKVDVSAAALTLDTTTETQEMSLPTDVVEVIPLNGRDYSQLIAASPGYGGYSVGGFGSLNGTRPNQMNWQLDGVDNNDLWHNVPAVNQGGVSGIAGTVLPIDSVEEFSAQTQSGAEAGRNPGGTVNVVVKSGTNPLHGSAYYYNRNEYYAAASPFFRPSANVPKPPPLRNQNYGLSLGGPIIKNKTFYFGSFEKQQYIIGLSGVATEPSDAWISQALGVLHKYGWQESPLSQTLIGPNGFWPRDLIGSLPPKTNNFFSPSASTGYSYNGVVRIDHNFSEKHHLYGRWFAGEGTQVAPLGSSPELGTASSNLKYYFEAAPLHVQNASAVLNSAFSTHLTNQALFGVNYFNQIFHDFNNNFDTKAMGLYLSPDATVNGKPIMGAPNIIIGPPASTGEAGFEQIGLTPPEGRHDLTWQLTDTVSFVTGNHTLRFGGQFMRGRVDEFYHRRGTGTFIFDGLSPKSPWNIDTIFDPLTKALADFLAGNVAGPSQLDPNVTGSTIAVGNPERFVVVNTFSLFFDDTWQVTRKLSLDLGLRYEYLGPFHSSRQDLANFIPGKGLEVQGAGLNSIYPQDWKNVAPRVGFAYSPRSSGDFVVRGGFGIYYDQINMNPFLDFRPHIAAAQGIQGNPYGSSPVTTYSLSGYNWDTQLAGGNSIFNGVIKCSDPNCTANPGLNLFSVSQDFRTPYFYNYNVQIEKSLGSAAAFQIGYVGSQGRRLSVVSNINQNGVLSSNFGSILQLNTIGTSNYNALQTVFNVRSWRGLTTQFAYTYSHALDEISEYRGVILDNPSNIKADYGNSDYDTRHLFTTTITYDLPRAPWASSGWADRLVNNWEFSSLWNFHTGQPSDEILSGLYLIGDPYAGASHKFSAAGGGTQWWNPAAFAAPCLTTITSCPAGVGTSKLGDISRNKFYGPGFADVDLSVIKNIPFNERIKLQLRADMFNLFNRINLASGPGSVGNSCSPNASAANPFQCTSSSGFGLVSDTIGDYNGAPGIGPGEAFNMQLAAKIVF